jgi:hypothetical protein
MKRMLLNSSAVMVFAILLTACQTHPEARIVRLKLDAGSSCWLYSVNGGGKAGISSSDLTNRLSRIHLHHGDLILFGTMPICTNGPALFALDWLSRICDSNGVAAYNYNASGLEDIFSIPVYHWVAPFNNPRGFAKASFFYEGDFLGYSTNGYQSMLSRIAHAHPPRILILGSRYNSDSSFGPNEAPYEEAEPVLNKVLADSGTEVMYLHALPGF